jgi:hypothetical protein
MQLTPPFTRTWTLKVCTLEWDSGLEWVRKAEQGGNEKRVRGTVPAWKPFSARSFLHLRFGVDFYGGV